MTHVLIPYGLHTPYGRCVDVVGADMRRVEEPYTGQTAMVMDVSSPQIEIELMFDDVPYDYPEVMFQPRPSKYSLLVLSDKTNLRRGGRFRSLAV